jgi:hypothetical protein
MQNKAKNVRWFRFEAKLWKSKEKRKRTKRNKLSENGLEMKNCDITFFLGYVSNSVRIIGTVLWF